MLRTHTAGELRDTHAGTEVRLCGWVDRVRNLGQLFFLSLRDRYGFTQCVHESATADDALMAQLDQLGLEDCVQVRGTVRRRDDKDINADMPTGAVEVVIEEVTVLNASAALPFQVKDETVTSDDNRLTYRYLDLRRPRMQRNLEVRHRVIQSVRSALCELDFLEIETPLLVRSTPEGARDFVVPSRLNPGSFYALPQSPQLYKQMLMISGCDRYFQFAPAFRDEDLRADRVPVHTQIDMEMTFVEEADVFAAVEHYLQRVFMDVLGAKLATPFPIMPYAEAMERYGSDKPDTRFGMELRTITDLAHQTEFAVFRDAEAVRCIVVERGADISRKVIDGDLLSKAKVYGAKGLAWTRIKDGAPSGGVGKFLGDIGAELCARTGAGEGALLLFVADRYSVCCAALNAVRLTLGRTLGLIDDSQHGFLWVNDFPLFEWDDDRQAYSAMHHLFTQPKAEDMPYLDTDPGKVHGQLYDLVLNGVELLSGSIRINRPEIQQKVLDIVQMPRAEADSKFGFLMKAFEYGAPPHGGSAMGLDRLVAILCGEERIREVIAYPCNNLGIFPLDGAPAPLEEPQLAELYLSHRPLPKES
ncbi:aspartate--tRNA ligase [Haliangium sp.]|uniref:aspartate--tRNA ligase n=1 Tax=Haliangium sp. TaxID=2663208 RepID=UPI003D0A695F